MMASNKITMIIKIIKDKKAGWILVPTHSFYNPYLLYPYSYGFGWG